MPEFPLGIRCSGAVLLQILPGRGREATAASAAVRFVIANQCCFSFPCRLISSLGGCTAVFLSPDSAKAHIGAAPPLHWGLELGFGGGHAAAREEEPQLFVLSKLVRAVREVLGAAPPIAQLAWVAASGHRPQWEQKPKQMAKRSAAPRGAHESTKRDGRRHAHAQPPPEPTLRRRCDGRNPFAPPPRANGVVRCSSYDIPTNRAGNVTATRRGTDAIQLARIVVRKRARRTYARSFARVRKRHSARANQPPHTRSSKRSACTQQQRNKATRPKRNVIIRFAHAAGIARTSFASCVAGHRPSMASIFVCPALCARVSRVASGVKLCVWERLCACNTVPLPLSSVASLVSVQA